MSDSSKHEEQSFTIQPHPATTNDPKAVPAFRSSLGDSVLGGKPGPQILDTSKLEEPLSKEELAKRSAELNK
ncbi:hypothetical protein ACQY0O_000936 [Thecaphora frezii]